MVKLTRVDIDSTDVSTKLLSWEFTEDHAESITGGILELKLSVTDLVTLDVGKTVEIWQGFTTSTDTKMFKGVIAIKESNGTMFKCVIKDELYNLVRRNATQDFDFNVDANAGKISGIFTDLVEDFGGLSTSGVSIQDSGTDLILQKFQANGSIVYERCQALADAIDWQFYYRADTDLVYFEPKGFTVNGGIINVGGTNNDVTNIPKWKDTIDESLFANKLELVGDFDQALQEPPDTFSGDASTVRFALTNTPLDLTVLVGGSEQVQGRTDVTTGSFDFELDFPKDIVFQAGSTPGVGVDNIVTAYHYAIPARIIVQDDVSISSYGLTEKKMTLTDVKNIPDAEERGKKYLESFGNPFRSTVLVIKPSSAQSLNIRRGDKVEVNDTINSITGQFVVRSVKHKWPDETVDVTIGDREWRVSDWEVYTSDRIKLIEDKLFENLDLINQFLASTIKMKETLVSFTSSVTNNPDEFLASDSSDVRSIVYDAANAQILDDFSGVGNWTQSDDGSAPSAESNFWTGVDQGFMRCAVDASASGNDYATYTNTTDSTDISGSTGAASGTPSRGSIGLWVRSSDVSVMATNFLRVRFGSSASDYIEFTVAQTDNYDSATMVDDGKYYFVFDLDSPDSTTGTPDWTAMDYVQLRIIEATSNTTDFNFDFSYFTVSKNNTIGLNGTGARTSDVQTVTGTF